MSKSNRDDEQQETRTEQQQQQHEDMLKRQRDQALLNIETASILVGAETNKNLPSNGQKSTAVAGKKKSTIRNALLGAYGGGASSGGIKRKASQQSLAVNNKNDEDQVNNDSSDKTLANNKFTGLPDIPVDWSLGSSIRFTSNRSLLWVSHLSDVARTIGMRQFISRGGTSNSPITKDASQPIVNSDSSDTFAGMNLSLDTCSKLYRSMLYFQFPTSPLPLSIRDRMRVLSFAGIRSHSVPLGAQAKLQQQTTTRNGTVNSGMSSSGGIISIVKKESTAMSSSSSLSSLPSSSSSSSLSSSTSDLYTSRSHSSNTDQLTDITMDQSRSGSMLSPFEAEQLFSAVGYQIFKEDLGEDATFLNDRMHDWCTSLSSIYALFSHGECPYFYMLRENQISVVFVCSNVCGSRTVRAMLTTVTPDRTLQLLHDSATEFDRRIDSNSFLFTGRARVHALYSFLLADCVKHVSSDLPTIVSPVPFVNAALKSLRIIRNESFVRVGPRHQPPPFKMMKKDSSSRSDAVGDGVADAATAADSGEQLHYALELSGFILPHAKHALVRTMASAIMTPTLTTNTNISDTNSAGESSDGTSSSTVHDNSLSVQLHNEKLTTWFNIIHGDDDADNGTNNSVNQQQQSSQDLPSNIGRCEWDSTPSEHSSNHDDSIFAVLRSNTSSSPTSLLPNGVLNQAHLSKITVQRSTNDDSGNRITYDITLSNNNNSSSNNSSKV